MMERKEMEQLVFANVLLLAEKLQVLGDSFIKPVTFKQWFLLLSISRLDKEKPSVTEIAEFIGSTRQNVRKMIDILEKKGFVTTEVDSNDKRNLGVSLTPATNQLFDNVIEIGNELLGKLFIEATDANLAVTLQTLKQTVEVSVESEGNNE